MSDLKPCPHCGGKGMIKRGKTVMVSCLECSASTFQVLDDPESAIAAWNRRAAPQASESTTGNKVLDDQVAAWARERARLDDLIAHATGSVTGSDADKLRRLREGMDKWGWCAEFGALAMEVLREPSAPASAGTVDSNNCTSSSVVAQNFANVSNNASAADKPVWIGMDMGAPEGDKSVEYEFTAPTRATDIATGGAVKGHNMRQLVNDLRDIALRFHATQQLRERISGAVGQFLDAHSIAPKVGSAAQQPQTTTATSWPKNEGKRAETRMDASFDPGLLTAQQQAATVPDDATLYRELIYAVGRKYPGESRHQTALRYIVSAERIGHGAAATTDGRNEA